MSVPALRKPKAQTKEKSRVSQNVQKFIILTLTNSMKLVVTSDTFHCITNVGDRFICVLCKTNMDAEVKLKENHKTLAEHHRLLKAYPFLEEFAENLIRQIDKTNYYCTICSVRSSVHSINRHVNSDEHKCELNKAILRAETYTPCVEHPLVGKSVDLNNNK